MRVKVCGITNVKDAVLCAELGTDALGFIFYKKSKRFINIENAKKIIVAVPSFTSKVGVFVNESANVINDTALNIGLSHIQLHGEEDQSIVDEIKLPVIKAIRINSLNDYEKVNNYSNCKFLLDTFSPKDFGGTGRKFDWSEIPAQMKSKIILSGGIEKDDLNFIFSEIHPEAIDLSSSLEILPGKKDSNKLIDFFTELRQLRGF